MMKFTARVSAFLTRSAPKVPSQLQGVNIGTQAQSLTNIASCICLILRLLGGVSLSVPVPSLAAFLSKADSLVSRARLESMLAG